MAHFAWMAPASTGLILLFASSVARAEPSAAELASARDMFSEARKAEDAGRWAEALVKLKAVANVKMTPQVRFHLGLCLEHTGHLVDALNSFEVAKADAIEQGVAAVVDEARDHANTMRARVPKLLIVLPAGSDPSAKVEVDGQVISSGLLARPLPFDPGRHTIAASSPGWAFSREITISEKEEKRIDVTFSPAPIVAAPKPAPAPAPAPATASANADSGRSSGGATMGWIAVGTGGLALAGAAITAVMRQDAIKHIDAECPNHQNCDRSLEDSQNKARTFGALAVALGAGGGALVITGIVLVLTSGSSQRPTTGISVTPWVGANGAGALGAMSW